MPSGQLLIKEGAWFSLDTNTIQSEGYKFSDGKLYVLRYQMLPWMRLVLSHIVVEEVVGHQLIPVSAAVGKLESDKAIEGEITGRPELILARGGPLLKRPGRSR